MYTKWDEVPMPDRIAWAEWAIDNNVPEQTEAERLAWVHARDEARAPKDPFAFELPVSNKSAAARLRSQRYQFQKKLDEHFKVYEAFTVREAANRTGVNEDRMRGYLEYESKLPSSRIARGPLPGTYQIMTGFEIGVERGA